MEGRLFYTLHGHQVREKITELTTKISRKTTTTITTSKTTLQNSNNKNNNNNNNNNNKLNYNQITDDDKFS